MTKEQLKTELTKKELIKPNSTEERLVLEVATLCEAFTPQGCTVARATGDIGSDNDILF